MRTSENVNKMVIMKTKLIELIYKFMLNRLLKMNLVSVFTEWFILEKNKKTLSNVLKSEADQGFVIPLLSVSVGFL